MPRIEFAYTVAALLCLAPAFATLQARATGLPNLDQFAEIHGDYAPGGDCSEHPRIMVDGNGLSVENGEARYKFERFDHATNFGGRDYSGISIWLMPLYGSERPLLLTFNSGERPGVLNVEPYDRGWAGGPPLSARHQRLVDASPYRKCKDMPRTQHPVTNPHEKGPAGAGPSGFTRLRDSNRESARQTTGATAAACAPLGPCVTS